jgi:hypothetical protein
VSFEDIEGKHFNEVILPRLLSKEVTTRLLLKGLLDLGAKINRDPNLMTHEECQDAVIKIYSDVKRHQVATRSLNHVMGE